MPHPMRFKELQDQCDSVAETLFQAISQLPQEERYLDFDTPRQPLGAELLQPNPANTEPKVSSQPAPNRSTLDQQMSDNLTLHKISSNRLSTKLADAAVTAPDQCTFSQKIASSSALYTTSHSPFTEPTIQAAQKLLFQECIYANPTCHREKVVADSPQVYAKTVAERLETSTQDHDLYCLVWRKDTDGQSPPHKLPGTSSLVTTAPITPRHTQPNTNQSDAKPSGINTFFLFNPLLAHDFPFKSIPERKGLGALFSNTCMASYADRGPQLITLSPGSPAVPYFLPTNRPRYGLLIESVLSQQGLLEHLQPFLFMETPDTDLLLLRWYDPFIFHYCTNFFPQPVLQALLRPLHAITYTAPSSRVHRVTPRRKTHDV